MTDEFEKWWQEYTSELCPITPPHRQDIARVAYSAGASAMREAIKQSIQKCPLYEVNSQWDALDPVEVYQAIERVEI